MLIELLIFDILGIVMARARVKLGNCLSRFSPSSWLITNIDDQTETRHPLSDEMKGFSQDEIKTEMQYNMHLLENVSYPSRNNIDTGAAEVC
jgi:hypothetical protein